MFLVLFMIIGFKLPTKFMLGELDLLFYYPFFGIVYSLLCAFSICQISKKKLTILRFVFIVISGLSAFVMIYLFSGNYNKLHVCICSALALVSGMAIPSEGPVVIDIRKILTFYKNGGSNPPAAGTGSGSGTTGSGSGATSRGAAGSGPSLPSLPSFSELSASIDGPHTPPRHTYTESEVPAAEPAGPSSSNAESAGTRPQPAPISDGYTRDNMSNNDLDHKFGPIPPKEEVDSIYNKIMAQKREIEESNKKSIRSTTRSTRSIFGDYSPQATLSPKDIKGLARMLLGENNRYIATVRGDPSNPYIRMMIKTGGTHRSIEQSNDLINILRKNNR